MLDERTITVTAFAGAPADLRLRRTILCLVSLLVLLTVGTTASRVAFLNHREKSNVKHAALLPSIGIGPNGSGLSGRAPNGTALSTGERTPAKSPAALDAQNILLIGSDSRSAPAKTRSDIIVLVHLSNDRKKVYLVDFPRDVPVAVPGHRKDKINAAYTYGGPQLVVRTVQQLVDVRIDHVVLVSLDGLKAMTDALGGLDVYAARASSLPGGGRVQKGVNHLDGATALAFARARPELKESDRARSGRQLAFVKALLVRSMSQTAVSNRIVLAMLMDAVIHAVTVDNAYSADELRSHTAALQGLPSNDVVTISAPNAGPGTSANGSSVNVVSVPPMARLSTALRNDTMDSLSLG